MKSFDNFGKFDEAGRKIDKSSKFYDNLGEFDEAGRKIEKPMNFHLFKFTKTIIIIIIVITVIIFLIVITNPQAIGQFMAKIVNGFTSTLK